MEAPTIAPVLSTPDNHIFEQPELDVRDHARLSDEQLAVTYEIKRTTAEIRAGRWKRIALQFPDHMLPDAPRVYQALSRGLKQNALDEQTKKVPKEKSGELPTEQIANMSIVEQKSALEVQDKDERLFILADTSYGACCVDEVAAEHADADVVVHYGRSCLTPTARLPVIYVFTTPPLELDPVVEAFCGLYSDPAEKVILMADIPYNHHLQELQQKLEARGYCNLFTTSLVHDASSPLPNRSTPAEGEELQQWKLFHVSNPPESLLLILSSRLKSIHIYSTSNKHMAEPRVIESSSARALRRRYATLVKLATVPIFGILINTLSARNYMDILAHVKQRIADAGKKSYTFVVGKVNAAKVANFSEVGGWVVIGCWESSLFENKDFWKPVITPSELELALMGDDQRVWTGQWNSDFQAVLKDAAQQSTHVESDSENAGQHQGNQSDGYEDWEESEPPEFDFGTGQYVSHSRPMKQRASRPIGARAHEENGKSLIQRADRDLATIGGVVSPAAEFLKTRRTWQGLGSDFADTDDATSPQQGAILEEGRRGIAKGYTVSGRQEAQ